FLTASLKQKKLIDMEDHPDEESFEVQEIRRFLSLTFIVHSLIFMGILVVRHSHSLEYLHRDETGVSIPSDSETSAQDLRRWIKRKRKRRYSFFPWKIYSDVFEAGDVADANDLPSGWSRYSPFSLAVVNQSNTNYSITRETTQDFSVKSKDWGFESFMNLSDLHDHTLGYLLDDTILVEAELWKVETKTPGECYASCGGCTWGERLRHLRHICSVFQKKTKV
ncbi:unnamed protein product, partial [Brassica oleracea var. botrytis]